ncbi:MAG: thermonuclease family protein [Cytophagales bacterium]|nr:thermonuclease family protein [Cytophagales bacterium]
MKFKVLLLAIGAGIMCSFSVDEIKGKVVSVLDGNTVEVLTTEGERRRILLHGIDSPDSGQNFSEPAKALLQKLVYEKEITLIIHGKDRKGNPLGELQVAGKPDPRRELIRQGLAWTTETIADFESVKESARKQGIGLWSEENPMPPWVFRRQQTMLAPKAM